VALSLAVSASSTAATVTGWGVLQRPLPLVVKVRSREDLWQSRRKALPMGALPG